MLDFICSHLRQDYAFSTHLLQYNDEAWGRRQLVVHDDEDGERSQHAGLHGRQDQTRRQRQPQFGGEAVVQRPPDQQRDVGNEQRVDEHERPHPGDRPQLPEGEEEQVELQDQPEMEEQEGGRM